MNGPVVTLPVPLPLYVLGSLLVWLLRAALFAILLLVLLVTSPVWVPLQRGWRRRHGQ